MVNSCRNQTIASFSVEGQLWAARAIACSSRRVYTRFMVNLPWLRLSCVILGPADSTNVTLTACVMAIGSSQQLCAKDVSFTSKQFVAIRLSQIKVPCTLSLIAVGWVIYDSMNMRLVTHIETVNI